MDKSEQISLLETQNEQAKKKIDKMKVAVSMLEIRKKHFEKCSTLHFFPLFLRAKYRLKAMELESEINSKVDFIRIYTERIANLEYAEKVIEPTK